MRRRQLDPRLVHGTGPGGRIVEADVKSVVGEVSSAAAPIKPGVSGVSTALQKPAPMPGQKLGVSLMRRAIAERTALSFSTVPHFYLRSEVDVTPLVEVRQQLLPLIQKETGAKLTLTDFVLRAMGKALAEFPRANSIWQKDAIVTFSNVDLGLVVGLPDGLLIPLLRNVDKLTLAEIVKQRSELVAAARAGQLPVEAMEGGAVSLSNLGVGAVDEFAPVIAHPQSSMLAMGCAAPRPFVVDGKLATRTTIRLCLAVDHRVMDGAPAGEMLGRIVELIQQPAALVREGASLAFE